MPCWKIDFSFVLLDNLDARSKKASVDRCLVNNTGLSCQVSNPDAMLRDDVCEAITKIGTVPVISNLFFNI